MDGAAVTEGYYLRYWEPTTRKETGQHVRSVGEVAKVADLIGEAYRQAEVAYLPGLALWRGVEEPENSLSLGIAPDGWAIVHTSEEFLQTVTRGSREPDGVRRPVQFDDFLEIPTVCFIERELALETVARWMATGELLSEAGFSEDLFSC